MSYSQSQEYPPQYQQTSDENPQRNWSSVDFAPSTAPLENYPQFPRNQAGYNAASLLQTSEQIAPSPNYSQYLNYDSMDIGPSAGPENAIPSQQLLSTPTVATTVNPQQYVNFPIKTEPEPNDLPFSQGLRVAQADEMPPPTCRANPLCLQILESPDMEMEDFNLGEWFPSSTISPTESQPARRPSHTASGSVPTSRKASADDGASSSSAKKPRRRGRKPAYNADDEDAQARAKQAHSVVERRYRDNLNGKIMQLHRTLSNISANSNRLDAPLSMVEGQEQRGSRVRKSDVMTDAVNYVHQSEVEMRHMSAEIERLTERVRTLEKLVRCEDCVLLKEMVRRSLQGQQQQG